MLGRLVDRQCQCPAFFFKVTLKRRDLADEVVSVREPRCLPVVLSPEEVGRLLASTTNIKRKAALRRFVAEQPYRRIRVSTHGAMVRQLMKHALPPGSPPARTHNTVLYILQYQAVADRLAVLTGRTDQLIGKIERWGPHPRIGA